MQKYVDALALLGPARLSLYMALILITNTAVFGTGMLSGFKWAAAMAGAYTLVCAIFVATNWSTARPSSLALCTICVTVAWASCFAGSVCTLRLYR